MVNNFEILVGAHSAATVVFFLANDVDFCYIKRVGGADNGADIKIVFDVFDSDFKVGTSFCELVKNLFIGVILEFVD